MSLKQRVDLLLVERGLAESRSLAQRLVMAGQVWADDQLVHKPSEAFPPEVRLELRGGPQYASRGGEKLAAALEAFDLRPDGWVCADIGASTGGFTDCLLQHGAAKVYAVDVGHGLLHWKLRNDRRVVLMERVNARHLAALPEPVRLVTIDVSFISLALIFPQVAGWLGQSRSPEGLSPAGQVVALVKPQFEAGRAQVGKGGVVRDVELHKEVLARVMAAAVDNRLGPQGLIRSPLQGPKGNQEFLLWLQPLDQRPPLAAEALLDELFGTADGK